LDATATGAQYRVAAGIQPQWFPDDRQMAYVRAARTEIVDIATWPVFAFGDPRQVPLPVSGGPSAGRHYDIAPDGKRFIVITQAGQSGGVLGSQIHVVLDWFEELKARGPTGK
jgi:hypothetical protein